MSLSPLLLCAFFLSQNPGQNVPTIDSAHSPEESEFADKAPVILGNRPSPAAIEGAKNPIDHLYLSTLTRINDIRASSSSEHGNHETMNDFRQKERLPREVELILDECRRCLAAEPRDWLGVQKSFYVAEFGTKDPRFTPLAMSVIKDDLPATIDLPRALAMMAALRLIGFHARPNCESFLLNAAKGVYWPEDMKADYRPDIRMVLQESAILALGLLPKDRCIGALEELAEMHPNMESDNPNSYRARMSRVVRLITEDVERREKGLPAVLPGLRD